MVSRRIYSLVSLPRPSNTVYTGINLEFARVLLRNDCNVLLADLKLRPEAQELVEQYQQQQHADKKTTKSARAVFHRTDATKWSDLASAFEAAEKEFGAYDIVCPGAGVFEPPWSGFWYPPGGEESRDAPDGDSYASIDLNLVHPIRASQLAISHFLLSASKDHPKTIVLISSIAGEMAVPMYPLYVACKWGLRGFLYSMAALEESRHIRVAGVAPAIVKTPIWLDNPDKFQLMKKDGVWDDDWTTPEEVADAVS